MIKVLWKPWGSGFDLIHSQINNRRDAKPHPALHLSNKVPKRKQSEIPNPLIAKYLRKSED